MGTGRAPMACKAGVRKASASGSPSTPQNVPSKVAATCCGSAKLRIGWALATAAPACVAASSTFDASAPLQ